MSGLMEEVSGGLTALRGPLKARMEFMRDCADVITSGEERTKHGTRRITSEFREELDRLLNWGILNHRQVAALSGINRVTLARIFPGMSRQHRTLRGTITPEGVLLLIQAMRMEYRGDKISYSTVAWEMVQTGMSVNVARALCGLSRNQIERAKELHDVDGGVRTEDGPLDTGHLVPGQEISWDLLPHPTGDRPGASEEAAPADLAGELPGAAAGDADADPSPAEDEGKQPKQPLLDPATLHGEELRIALEEGRAWYPEIENPIDESGDSYLQGSRIAPPDDFMAAFEALEQADE